MQYLLINLAMEKPGRHHFNKVVEVNMTSSITRPVGSIDVDTALLL